MPMHIIVTVKQVPDTQNIKGEAMKPDGTVNRGALPAVMNPEDLNALEEALCIKETLGARITAVTMGPPAAVKVLKECLFRGVDDVILISDKRFAGADTLATSYALKCAIKKIGAYDMILCGRQAIDGDTAQVGPQLAEKLKINQLTSVFEIKEISENRVTVARSREDGFEIASAGFPVLLTITDQANEPRSPRAKLVFAYKNMDKKEISESYDDTYLDTSRSDKATPLQEWNLESIEADPSKCGLQGSPTKVKRIRNIVLSVEDSKQIPCTEAGINELVHELKSEHIIG
jgi:electron transfer flavoprotein beta subunit